MNVEETSDSCPNIYDFENYRDMEGEEFHMLMSVNDISYSDLFSDGIFENEGWAKCRFIYILKVTSDGGKKVLKNVFKVLLNCCFLVEKKFDDNFLLIRYWTIHYRADHPAGVDSGIISIERFSSSCNESLVDSKEKQAAINRPDGNSTKVHTIYNYIIFSIALIPFQTYKWQG